MVRPGALPVGQQVLLVLVAPPILAAIWWLKARGWAKTVQGGSASAETKGRQRMEFWAVLILGYIVAIGVTLYAWLTDPTR